MAVWRERAAILYANHPRVRCLFSVKSRDHEIEKVDAASRKKLVAQHPELEEKLPPSAGGLECVALIDDRYAATFRFRDQPRAAAAASGVRASLSP